MKSESLSVRPARFDKNHIMNVIKEMGAPALEELKTGVDKAWDEIKIGVDRAKGKLFKRTARTKSAGIKSGKRKG